MCTTCGCGEADKPKIAGLKNSDDHAHDHAHEHEHGHGYDHTHEHGHDHCHDVSSLKVERSAETIQVEKNILFKNDEFAIKTRQHLKEHGILAINLVSSPGSGKTTLLTRTIENAFDELSIGVIEGDQATENDARKIKETGARVIQINTGAGCHLEAEIVSSAIEALEPEDSSLIFIENVGNLVCPALFDLGEYLKVVILSVTEGEDKPLKYPHMFRESSLMILNKVDLLPYVEFDVSKCIDYARQVNPEIEVLEVSATTKEGLDLWIDWLRAVKERFVRQEKPELV